ncbi:histidinol-phosphate transaminase [Saccharobesus litoralis]|uniref:Histidinol-phosphate aminotransferase n=1 Tax=Saccharobesus litoralis TaxID=2172099 RepID=A0A2S0VTN6_9ALTE|nr:histidinol-phosphate transaminase [Saccharobesus litoralis]AWB67553.1 histidinol-phosphate transaminase [Saccharobesus litoralis]
MSLADSLTRKNIQGLVPYASARRSMSGGNIWLNANESPFANRYELDDSVFNRYPDFQPKELIEAYAAYAQVEKTQVLASRGADEAIELLIRTFCENDEKILICPPTYGMYAISAETCNIGTVKVPLKSDFTLDLPAIEKAKKEHKIKVVFICSPNNPTGHLMAADQIKTVLNLFADSAIVAVDEAYIEFSAEKTVAPWINDYANLAVLRTMSKAFGLAGIRCGYTLANENIIAAMSKVIAPYPISWPVAQIASQALSVNGLERMQSQLAQVLEQKERIVNALDQLEYVYEQLPSASNFVLFRTKHKKALFAALVEQGILIRDYSQQIMLDDSLRISIGSEQETDALLEAMRAFGDTL